MSIKGLTKRFKDTIAVDDVSFEVDDKQFMILLGPSGSGKTTILRCVAGLETPDDGEIRIGDELVNEVPPKDRDIAMVFQHHAIYPHLSVHANLAFPLKIRHVRKDEIEKRVKNVAELLRIPHLLSRLPNQLSGGEAQRVALGRAVIREPRVFLMDEPLSSLDAKLRLYMRAELKNLQKELGITTIYVTHDQSEALTMGDRVAVINSARLQQLDTPQNVYNNPVNSFVGGFIGNPPMNLLDSSFITEGESGFLDNGTFKLRLSKNIKEIIEEKATSSELTLGIRPENIIIDQQETSGSTKVKIFAVEPLGSEVIVDIKLGEVLVKTRNPPDFENSAGETVWLKIDQSKMHIFDKKTGKNIF